jgi:hypothetical protein
LENPDLGVLSVNLCYGLKVLMELTRKKVEKWKDGKSLKFT